MKSKSKLLSRASLRTPFIVTVSAVAAVAAAACGGSVAEGGTTAQSDLNAPSVNPPPPVACPVAEPAQGAACDVASPKECGYKDCNGSPSVTATCGASGTWNVVEMSCNPPEPQPCPTAQPTAGAACGPIAGVSCGYKDCMGTPSVLAKCEADGKWSVVEMSCNPPPPPSCPAAQPASGDACSPSLDTKACGYKDCNGTPAVTATCGADAKWSVDERSCNPPIPMP